MSIIPIIIIAVAVVLFIVLIFAMIKTANGNEALVVSGVGATDKNGNPEMKFMVYNGKLNAPVVES